MAGHSKWANMKHRKARQDGKCTNISIRIIRELTVVKGALSPVVFWKYLLAILLSIVTFPGFADYSCAGNQQQQEFIYHDVSYTGVLCWGHSSSSSKIALSLSLYRDDLLAVQTWMDLEPEADVVISFVSEEYSIGDVLEIPVFVDDVLRGGTFREEWKQFWLFTFDGNELRRVLSESAGGSFYSRMGCEENCDDGYSSTLEIEVSPDSSSYGLQDLILHRESVDTTDGVRTETKTKTRFIFSGKQYEPKN